MCMIEGRGTGYARWMVAVMLGMLLGACERAQLQIAPARVSACEVPVELEVSWDARSLGWEDVYLEAAAIGQKPKRWHEGESFGTRRTGKWIYGGWTVTLYAGDGTKLARRTLVTDPCDNEPEW